MIATRFFPLVVLAIGLTIPANSFGDLSLPRAKDGRPLNFDFETGDLRDWTAVGEAFQHQPVDGDAIFARRKDMKSQHAGRYWVGSFEGHGDRPHGSLTSVPFVLEKPYARFLIAGGSRNLSRFEIVRKDTGKVVYQSSGDNTEELKPFAADLSSHVGKEIFLRLIDQDSDGWGHISFDDFKLSDTKPDAPFRQSAPSADVYAHEGLPPEKAAEAMTLPPGFKVTLFAGEPDVVQPIAFAIDDRGRLWVAEAYSYPVKVPQSEARDRILIFEDRDNDGRFDSKKVFADKLNLVSGLEIGFGGIYVGAAPHLLFIPEKNGDDVADGPPQILLDGFGYHDTHETLNSFNWGPDGWLYGCHGVFTHSLVGKPGTPNADRTPINAGIWRYHPTKHLFEVFSQGTSNPWGIDFDEHGQAIETACVIPHLYHMIQGGRYERQAGPHFNPSTYDDIKTIADHRHYVGANPHAANGRSDEAGGGHAHSGALIYLGESFPREYRGSLFMNNIHGARLNRDILEPKGSGFVGHHAPDFLMANDRWSQIVSLKSGPDGSVFMIDWYDKNQCHRNEVAIHDRTNGRVFKVSYGTPGGQRVDAIAPTVSSLTSRTPGGHWPRRHTLRRLQEASALGALPDREQAVIALKKLALGTKDGQPADSTVKASSGPGSDRLYGLWGLHVIGALDLPTVLELLDDGDPYLRGWAIQLSCENGRPAAAILDRFAVLAKADASPIVRLYLCSALQRLPLESRWQVLEGLVSHAEDAGDHNLPLMNWYAAEPLASVDASRALNLAESAKLPNFLPFMVRRISAIGTSESIALLVDAIGATESESVRLTLIEGLNEALKGRREVAMPSSWPKIYPSLRDTKNRPLSSAATALALTFGDPGALKLMRSVLSDSKSDPARRSEALSSLLKARDQELPPVLRVLIGDRQMRAQAIRGLAAFEDPKTPEAILDAYVSLTPEERRDALNTLAARVSSARPLLAAVGAARVPRADLSADLVRQIRNLKNAELDTTLGKVWGNVRETSTDRAKTIARFKNMLTSQPKQAPDVELGRAMFAKTCQQCHVLFGVGGKIGPELTGSNRADLDYILTNVLDPSALIGKDYLATALATSDGRVLTGIVKSEDNNAITLQTANEVVVIPRAEVEARRPSEQSMMPEDLWNPLSEHQVRSLTPYLASPKQVPMLATPENVSGFFNGRDLTGWNGDTDLWKVENGEIVGKTDGLKHNAFLVSTLAIDDFRLTVQVQLVANRGNSGVQFHSVALAGGEMRGPQADIGTGWWGKLYEENSRGLLWDKSGEAHVKSGEWNTYEIVASGPKVRTWINGAPAVSIEDPAGSRRGIFAFQLHSGGPTEVQFKEITLELEPPPRVTGR